MHFDQTLNNFNFLVARLEENPSHGNPIFERALDVTDIHNQSKFELSTFIGRRLDKMRKKI